MCLLLPFHNTSLEPLAFGLPNSLNTVLYSAVCHRIFLAFSVGSIAAEEILSTYVHWQHEHRVRRLISVTVTQPNAEGSIRGKKDEEGSTAGSSIINHDYPLYQSPIQSV